MQRQIEELEVENEVFREQVVEFRKVVENEKRSLVTPTVFYASLSVDTGYTEGSIVTFDQASCYTLSEYNVCLTAILVVK